MRRWKLDFKECARRRITRVWRVCALHVFWSPPAFPTCCGPHWLSPLGESGDPGVCSSEPLLPAEGIERRMMRRTRLVYFRQSRAASRSANTSAILAGRTPAPRSTRAMRTSDTERSRQPSGVSTTRTPSRIRRVLPLHEAGWTVEKPIQRATQSDEAAITTWREQTWPAVQAKPRRRSGQSSS